MPWVGQTFQRTDGTRSGPEVWQEARTAGVKIVADGHDTHDEDMATGVTDCVRKSGLNTATANLPMGGFRHTNVGNATARTEYASAADIQDGGLVYTTTVAGTGDAVTITLSLPPSNYTGGQILSWVAGADNTGPVTINVNGLGAKSLEKSQQPLVAKDLTAGDTVTIVFDSARDTFQLLSHQRTPVQTTGGSPYAPGTLFGLTLSNNTTDATNDIDIATGNARDAADTANLIVSAAIGKRIDASWAAGGTPGTPTGGLSSSLSPVQDDTWYNVILGKVSDVVEVGFDTDPAGATLVTDHSFTNPRRIGSVRRATATNLAFIQSGDLVLFDVPPVDSLTAITLTDASVTLTVPPNVIALIGVNIQHDDNVPRFVYIRPTGVADAPASGTTNANLSVRAATAAPYSTSGQFSILADAASQIRASASATMSSSAIYTYGYTDRRGRDG